MRIAVCVPLLFMLMASAVAETVLQPSPLDSAKALISQGKQKDAIPILEKIVASDPDSAPQALDMMADCYDALEKWSKAIECLQKLQALSPKTPAPREIKLRFMDYYLAIGDLEKYQSLRKELADEYRGDGWRVYYTVGRRLVLKH